MLISVEHQTTCFYRDVDLVIKRLTYNITLTIEVLLRRNINKVHSFKQDHIFIAPLFPLRIFTGKKHRQIKLQRLEKVRIWAFGLFVH